MVYETLLYFIPLIFFGLQSLISFIIDKKSAMAQVIIGMWVTPFATSFFFLQISMSFFIGFVIASFFLALLATISYAADNEKAGNVFTFLCVILIFVEYGIIFNIF